MQALLRLLQDTTTLRPSHNPLLHPPCQQPLPRIPGDLNKTPSLLRRVRSSAERAAVPFTYFPTHPHPLQGHHQGCCVSRKDAGEQRGSTRPAGPLDVLLCPDQSGTSCGVGGLNPATSGSPDLRDLVAPARARALSAWGFCLYKGSRHTASAGWQPGCGFSAPSCGPWVAALALLPPRPPPPVLPGSTAFTWLWHPVRAPPLSRSPRPAAAASPRCHRLNGIIYLFMSPDVSSPGEAWGEGRCGSRGGLGCPGARLGAVRGRTREEGAGWGRGEGRRTEHAPEDAAAGTCRRRLCGSRHSTSDFSSDQERSVVAGPPRLAPSPVLWRPT